MAGNPKLIDKLLHSLGADEALIFREVISVAEMDEVDAYAVGGTVRDLFLGARSLDVDVAVDGDAIDLAHSVAARSGARVIKSTRFGTATLVLGPARVDVATARREKYRVTGALPDTDAAEIEDDLLRRDFTINAIALGLTGPVAGDVLDPAGGRNDLRNRVIRVLHDNSLRDDPTRMIRAARYEQRLGFGIHPETAVLIQRDLSTMDSVSGTRVRQEIDRTLHEYSREKILLRMDGLGVLAAIHPGLAFGPSQAAAMRCLRRSAYDSVLALWAIIGWTTADEQIGTLCGRLAPSGRLRDVLHSLPEAQAAAREIGRDSAASAVAARLRPMPSPTVRALACAAKTSLVRDRVLDYLRRTRNLRPRLSGDDLIALGLAEGPEIGTVLSRLRDARIDGTTGSRDDEVAIVKRVLSERRVPVGT